MPALCLFLAHKSIASCPPSFLVEVQGDGFKVRENCTAHIEGEKKEIGNMRTEDDRALVSQKPNYKTVNLHQLQLKCWRIGTGVNTQKGGNYDV